MKIASYDRFLTKGQDEISSGFVAAGIHPSSEVDLVNVGVHRLGVGAIVPLRSANATANATPIAAVRRGTGPLTLLGIPNRSSSDGIEFPGEKLVLQLYEAGDALVPPSGRSPVYRMAFIGTDLAGAAVGAANALLAFRLPMQGRKHAAISFYADDGTDFSVTLVGHRLGYVDKPDSALFTEDADGPYTWFNGSVTPPELSVASMEAARTIHIGGHGDDLESFDELSVWVHDGDVLGSGSIVILGEADGERG